MNALDAVALVALAVWQANVPFFSNDVQGAIKVLLTFGGSLGVLITLVVKLTQSRYVEQIAELKRGHEAAIKDLQGQLDGLGGRVNDANAHCTRLSEAQRQHELSISRHTQEHATMNGHIGELRASVTENGKNAEALHHESMQTWLESAARINESVTAARLDIRELQTMNKLAEQLAALVRAIEKRNAA